ncbi:hypothetical protein [Microbacterium sp. NPDC057650]|uniref:hypothetical protein n=1 Tax=unclassified Microbacterium TaxID=2609290 RepID=UPI00366E73EC
MVFVALAVVIALLAHPPAPGNALFTLLVTTLGTLLAVFVADVLAHAVSSNRMMTRHELRHALFVSFGAFTAVTIPVLALLIALAGWWTMEVALRVSAVGLVASLVLIGYLAVRRIPLTWWQRALALAGEAAIGIVVVALQSLAHG